MGDRANIRFKQSSGQIYFYSHWSGLDLATDFQAAFKNASSRWNDESYCTAYCIGQLLKPDIDSITGRGISTDRGDNEHNCVEVDFPAQVVRLRSGEGWHDKDFDWEKDAKTLKEWTFSGFSQETNIHSE